MSNSAELDRTSGSGRVRRRGSEKGYVASRPRQCFLSSFADSLRTRASRPVWTHVTRDQPPDPAAVLR
jgi:hypothetical protein